MSWLAETSEGCRVSVKAVPRASKTELAAVDPEWLRIRLQAPPVDGKANAALIEFFAELFGIPRRDITVETGATARIKRVFLKGLAAVDAIAAVQPANRSR